MTPRILVALDAEDPAVEAEQLAITLARATGSQLVLATVYPIIDVHSRVDTRHFERLLRREAERFLGEHADALGGEGVELSLRAVGSHSAARGLRRLARR